MLKFKTITSEFSIFDFIRHNIIYLEKFSFCFQMYISYNFFIKKRRNFMNNDVLKSIALKAKRRLVGKDKVVEAKIKTISNEDSVFKNKVEFLLSQTEIVSNPVHYLIDDKVLKNMQDNEKERYLFSTLDKYSSLKNQLENMSNDIRYCM